MALLFLALILLSVAFAHDTWILPESDRRVALSTGSTFPTPDSKVRLERVFRFFGFAANGARLEPAPVEEDLNLVVDSDAVEFGAELRPHEIILDREKALAYLQEEGATNLLKTGATEFREEYTKFARFSRDRKGSSFGHELELMIDGDLVVPILRGAARKNWPIRLTSKAGAVMNMQSGDKGALELPDLPSGTWMARIHYIEPSPKEGFDARSLWATHTFIVGTGEPVVEVVAEPEAQPTLFEAEPEETNTEN